MDVNVYAIWKLTILKWIHLPFIDHIEHIQPKLHLRSMRLRVRKLLRKRPRKI